MNALKLASLLALLLVITPCLLYFGNLIGLSAVKWLALAGTIAWFIATPLWMGRDLQPDDDQVQI